MNEAIITVTALGICLIGFLLSMYFDLRFHKIPNKLTFTVIITGLLFNLLVYGIEAFLYALLGAGIAFVILFPLFMIRALAAGDIKLLMGVGAFWGTGFLLQNVLYSFAIGGIWALFLGIKQVGFAGVVTTLKRYYQCFFFRTYFPPENDEIAGLKVPFAPAMALGWIWVCFNDKDLVLAINSVSEQLI